jgi:hypothetical protein
MVESMAVWSKMDDILGLSITGMNRGFKADPKAKGRSFVLACLDCGIMIGQCHV